MVAVGGAGIARVAVKKHCNGPGGGSIGEVEKSLDRTQQTDKLYTHICKLIDEQEDPEHPSKPTNKQNKFQMIGSIIVFASILVLAIDIDHGTTHASPLEERLVWTLINSVFIIAFLAEILAGFLMGGVHYFFIPWHWLDMFITGISVLDAWIFPLIFTDLSDRKSSLMTLVSLLRVLRLGRLFRMVKVLQQFKQLYIALMAWWAALTSIVHVFCIMLMGMGFYAMLGTVLIGQNEAFLVEDLGGRTVYDCFGSISKCMYTLFQLMTLEGFEEITRPLVLRQPWLFFYFTSFIMLFTFGLMNMLVGLVVEKTLSEVAHLEELESNEQHKKHLATIVATLGEVWQLCDPDGKGAVSWDDFSSVMSGSESVARDKLETLQLPFTDYEEFFQVIDCDGDGAVTREEFIAGTSMYKSHDDVAAKISHSATKTLRHEIQEVAGYVKELHKCLVKFESLESKMEGEFDDPKKRGKASLGSLNPTLHQSNLKGTVRDSPRSELSSPRRGSDPRPNQPIKLNLKNLNDLRREATPERAEDGDDKDIILKSPRSTFTPLERVAIGQAQTDHESAITAITFCGDKEPKDSSVEATLSFEQRLLSQAANLEPPDSVASERIAGEQEAMLGAITDLLAQQTSAIKSVLKKFSLPYEEWVSSTPNKPGNALGSTASGGKCYEADAPLQQPKKLAPLDKPWHVSTSAENGLGEKDNPSDDPSLKHVEEIVASCLKDFARGSLKEAIDDALTGFRSPLSSRLRNLEDSRSQISPRLGEMETHMAQVTYLAHHTHAAISHSAMNSHRSMNSLSASPRTPSALQSSRSDLPALPESKSVTGLRQDRMK